MNDILLDLLKEILLQFLFLQGFRRIVDLFEHPLASAAFFGVIAGLMSLLLFKYSFIEDKIIRLASLIFFPILLGCIMSVVGKIYAKLNFKHSSLDRFATGFFFGLTLSLTRVLGTLYKV